MLEDRVLVQFLAIIKVLNKVPLFLVCSLTLVLGLCPVNCNGVTTTARPTHRTEMEAPLLPGLLRPEGEMLVGLLSARHGV
jgi:hypothetical protein